MSTETKEYLQSITITQDSKKQNRVLTITKNEDSGEAPIKMVNPQPFENSYRILEADKVMVYPQDKPSEYGPMKVEYHIGEKLHEFWCEDVDYDQ